MTTFDESGIDVETIEDPELTSPVVIEGLPGVGFVGKLAVEHLIEEADSTVIRRIYSEHLPPQVSLTDGVASLAAIEIHHVRIGEQDLLVIAGDQQSQTPAGYYRLADALLSEVDELGAERIYALGGVPTGEIVEEYSVLGAVSASELITDLEALGVEFRDNEPAGGVVGISGLLLGLGGRRGFDVACLMGETSGYIVDPKSAQEVLAVLEGAIGFDVEYGELETRAEELEEVLQRLQVMQPGQPQVDSKEEIDLRYID